MTINTFINLPVADLARTRKFFETLGFAFNEHFSDETALGMIISENSFAMLLTHEKFRQFTPRPIADARESTEVLTCLQLESREAVDRMTDTALSAGGSHVRDAQDHGFMYGRAFQDPDGHIWELIWMDLGNMPCGEKNGNNDG